MPCNNGRRKRFIKIIYNRKVTFTKRSTVNILNTDFSETAKVDRSAENWKHHRNYVTNNHLVLVL